MQLKALESGASNDIAEKDQRIEDLNRVRLEMTVNLSTLSSSFDCRG